MAAVTSSGLWPVADQNTLSSAAVTYTPVTPRQAIAMSTLAFSAITGSSSSGGSSSNTTVPTTPAFTRFPVTP